MKGKESGHRKIQEGMAVLIALSSFFHSNRSVMQKESRWCTMWEEDGDNGMRRGTVGRMISFWFWHKLSSLRL